MSLTIRRGEDRAMVSAVSVLPSPDGVRSVEKPHRLAYPPEAIMFVTVDAAASSCTL